MFARPLSPTRVPGIGLGQLQRKSFGVRRSVRSPERTADRSVRSPERAADGVPGYLASTCSSDRRKDSTPERRLSPERSPRVSRSPERLFSRGDRDLERKSLEISLGSCSTRSEATAKELSPPEKFLRHRPSSYAQDSPMPEKTLRQRLPSHQLQVREEVPTAPTLESDIQRLWELFHSAENANSNVLRADEFARAQNTLADMAVEDEFAKALKVMVDLNSLANPSEEANGISSASASTTAHPSKTPPTSACSSATVPPTAWSATVPSAASSATVPPSRSQQPDASSTTSGRASSPQRMTLGSPRASCRPGLRDSASRGGTLNNVTNLGPGLRSRLATEPVYMQTRHTLPGVTRFRSSPVDSQCSPRSRFDSRASWIPPGDASPSSSSSAASRPTVARRARTPPPPASGHGMQSGNGQPRSRLDSANGKPVVEAQVSTSVVDGGPPYLESLCTTDLRIVSTCHGNGPQDDEEIVSIDQKCFTAWQLELLYTFAKTPDSRRQILAHAVSRLQRARDQIMIRASLKQATTVSTMRAAIAKAEQLLRTHEVEQHRRALQSMLAPFLVQFVSPVTGVRHEVQASREQLVRSLREAAALHFETSLYRVVLTFEGQCLETDSSTLEACNIVMPGAEIITTFKEYEPWRDVPMSEFLERLVHRSIASREAVASLQRRLASGAEDEATCRARFFQKIRTMEAKDHAIRAEAERHAMEILQWEEEGTENDARMAEVRRLTGLPERLEKFINLPAEELLNYGVAAGLFSETTAAHALAALSAGGLKSLCKQELVQRIACHEALKLWAVEIQRLYNSIASAQEKWDRELKRSEGLRQDAERDLQSAQPNVQAAAQAIAPLKKDDLYYFRTFNSPPQPVMKVMEAVCILLRIPLPGSSISARWQAAKAVMLQDRHFLPKVLALDKDTIDDDMMRKLEPLISSEELCPENLRKISESSMRVCCWVRAMVAYRKAVRFVHQSKATVQRYQSHLEAYHAAAARRRAHLRMAEESTLRLTRELQRLGPLPRLFMPLD